jgi:glyoxylase-like metal-dependent hydrolase (beta-lactamase superfamily II)
MRSPGHTKDSFIVALTHAPDSVHSKLPILFTGDTLLLSSIGEIEDAAAYWQTLQRFRGFQGETLVFPGHRLQKENLLFAKTLDPSNQVINAKL